MSPKQLSTVTPTEFDRTTPLKEFMTTCSLEERSRIFTEIYRNTLLLEGNDPDWALGGAGRNNWVMAGASSRGYLSGEEFAEEHLRVWTVWKLARDIRDYPPQGGIQALSMASDEQRATSTVSDTPVVSVFRSWASNLGAPKTFRDMSRRFQRDRSPHASARSDQASSAQSTVSSISDLDLIPLPLPLSIQESLGPRGLELVIRSLQILNDNPPTLGTEGDRLLPEKTRLVKVKVTTSSESLSSNPECAVYRTEPLLDSAVKSLTMPHIRLSKTRMIGGLGVLLSLLPILCLRLVPKLFVCAPVVSPGPIVTK
jgi:hypothetical protein